MRNKLRTLAKIFSSPVDVDQKKFLNVAWSRLPQKFKGPRQMYGLNGTGCGATIGAMPKCDFACVGCYLGEEANKIPYQSVGAIKKQMRQLREKLGDLGNLQLTDGEVTLRPVNELIELIRYAREIGLVPMLMTHGDTFRYRPNLLPRLIVEAGLTEVSIHVDTTQRGRRGVYKDAKTEEELNPLRDEFAQMIRRVRKETGRPVEAATTMTISSDNIAGVPSVMGWFMQNTDAFKLISFQPMAQVGRTVGGLGGTAPVEELWEKIALGVYGSTEQKKILEAGRMWYGHPDCSRLVPGLTVTQPGKDPTYHPIIYYGDPIDEKVILGFIHRFGGISFRTDDTFELAARLLGVFAASPWFFLSNVFSYPPHFLKRMDPEHPVRFLWRLLTGQAKLTKTNIISHHFMSDEEVKTETGKERLDVCVFHVPINDKITPMCEVNATDTRDNYYEQIRQAPKPSEKPEPVAELSS